LSKGLSKYFSESFIIKIASRVGGTVTLTFMMLLVTADILTRYIKKPMVGAVELTQVTMVIFVSLALANAQREGQNVNVSIFMKRFSERVQIKVNTLILFLSLLFFLLMIWRTGIEALKTYRLNMTWWNLPFPLWIPYVFVPIGFILLSMELLAEIIQHLKLLNRKAGN
jgi:TRAP-type C4-dicarboxylate transport system permease small subunit